MLNFVMLNSTEHEIYHVHKFISMRNATFESLKARKVCMFSILILQAVEMSCSVEYNIK